MGSIKKQYVPIDNFNSDKLIEKFINGKLDLYVQLSQIEGWANFKDHEYVHLDVTGYCKLTESYKNYDIFKLDPDKFLLVHSLEIIEIHRVYARSNHVALDWEKDKKDNFFVPFPYDDPSKALQSPPFGLFPYGEPKVFVYSIPQRLLLIEKEQSKTLKKFTR